MTKLTKQTVLELGWSVLPHPPYLPVIASTDYHLFRALQSALNEKQFTTDKQVQQFVENFFMSKPINFTHVDLTNC